MSVLTGMFSTCAVFLIAFAMSTNAEDFSLQTKSGSKLCVGKICDDSNAFYYFECCGTVYDDCCFKLQTWVIVALAVAGILFLISAIGGFIKCICCCDR